MQKTLLMTMLAGILAVGVTGCQSFQEHAKSYQDRNEKLTHVMGNTWRLEYVWPGKHETTRVNDALQTAARKHCDRYGMLPLYGAVEEGDETKPTKGWLEFRCQAPVNVIKKGILSEDDALRFEVKLPE